MQIQPVPFDIVAELDSEEAQQEYLAQVLADGDDEEILRAMGHVAKARDRVHAAGNEDRPTQPIHTPLQG